MKSIFLKNFWKKEFQSLIINNLIKKIMVFFVNYMYTIMDKSIVENKLKDLDYKSLKEQLLQIYLKLK